MTTLTTGIGATLREARITAGMTLIDVVFALRTQGIEELRISPATLSRIETDRGTPSSSLLAGLSKLYDVALSELVPANIMRDIEAVKELLAGITWLLPEATTSLSALAVG